MMAGKNYVQRTGSNSNIKIFRGAKFLFLCGLLSLINAPAFSHPIEYTPVFVGGSLQLFSVCESSGATSIDPMLAIYDADISETETWDVHTAPVHGSLSGFPASVTSTGDTLTAPPFTYTPTAGYYGFDTFVIQITDGTTVSLDTMVVTINPLPTLSSSTTLPAICSGSPVSYIPTSPVAGTSFSWVRPFVGGIYGASASDSTSAGSGNPNEILNNITYYGITVTYIYTMVANGCSNTQNVTVTVNPAPALSSALSDTTCNGQAFIYAATSNTTGTSFSWTRASVSGISPATSAGAGNSINEALTNSTSSPVNVTYAFNLSANGCTSVRNVNLTVEPPVAGVPFSVTPPSSLCTGAMYQNFGASAAPGTDVTYTWSATNATIVATGNNNQYSIVDFNTPGNAVVTLSQTIPGSPCLATTTYNVTVSDGENPAAQVIYYNGQFVYLDNTMDTYQWGADDAATLSPSVIPDANFQSYPDATPDFTDNYYWVITSKNGCSQKTYYNAPLAVTDVQHAVGLKVYPNPATGNVSIDINGGNGTAELVLVNMLGQTMKTVSGNAHTLQLNVADVPAGCYLVNCMQNGQRVATTRLIKN